MQDNTHAIKQVLFSGHYARKVIIKLFIKVIMQVIIQVSIFFQSAPMMMP